MNEADLMVSMGVVPFVISGWEARLVAGDRSRCTSRGSRCRCSGRPALAGRDGCDGAEEAVSYLGWCRRSCSPRSRSAFGGGEVLRLSGVRVGVAVAAVATLRDVPAGRRGAGSSQNWIVLPLSP